MHVAPLSLHKVPPIYETITPTQRSSQADDSHLQTTRPATPSNSQPDLQTNPSVFHNFLLAIYPFHPAYAISDTTVKLPLTNGDVILVHSIHTNGWADGTLLASGARGWLPTNYCEVYSPELTRKPLRVLSDFWDLLQSGLTSGNEVFADEEFMRGIAAGVFCLLVSDADTQICHGCLH
jgi:hypothetical protein